MAEALRRVATGIGRALRLRCPRCGRAPLYRGWFTMNEVCPVCDLKFERAQGYWVGAIYVNYAATTLVAMYFMHLKLETRTLALIAVTPLTIATLLVLVLLPDGFAVAKKTVDEKKVAAPAAAEKH